MDTSFIWDDKPQTIKEILSSEFLPQVIKAARDGSGHTDPSQDILVLFRDVSGSRVLARVPTPNPSEKCLAFIPTEYKGWFTFENNSPDQVNGIRSISKVLEIMPRVFLTCTEITCYYELSRPENGADYVKGHIDGNECLTVNSMYEGYIKYSNLRGKVKRKLERFLKVSTSSRKIALLRVKQEGQFYIVDLGKNRHTDAYDTVSVHRVKEVLTRTELPVRVYPIGDKNELKFTKKTKRQQDNSIELLETVPFNAVVACTLHSRGNQLIELPLHTEVKYQRAVQTPPAKSHEALRKTLIFADSHVDKFLAKITYKPLTNGTS